MTLYKLIGTAACLSIGFNKHMFRIVEINIKSCYLVVQHKLHRDNVHNDIQMVIDNLLLSLTVHVLQFTNYIFTSFLTRLKSISLKKKYHSFVSDVCRIWKIILFVQQKRLKIPKGQSESAIRKRTDNTMTKKKKGQKNKQGSTKHTHRAKCQVTRTPLKTGVELRCYLQVGMVCLFLLFNVW